MPMEEVGELQAPRDVLRILRERAATEVTAWHNLLSFVKRRADCEREFVRHSPRLAHAPPP